VLEPYSKQPERPISAVRVDLNEIVLGVAMQRVNIGGSKGSIPTIACINRATVDLGVDFASLISALQKYVDEHLAPVWSTPAKLVRAKRPRPKAWTMLFVDTAKDIRRLRKDLKKIFGKNANEVLAFHLFKSRPIALVFVKTVLLGTSALTDNDRISLAASHELAEMLVDPANNLWCTDGKDKFYAYEVCDAVEANHFKVDGFAMSNFVYPAFFEGFRKRNSAQFDHMKMVQRPFQILKDGYAPVRKAGKVVRLHAFAKKRRELRREDRDLHRSEFR
jgi:hypothetical protein